MRQQHQQLEQRLYYVVRMHDIIAAASALVFLQPLLLLLLVLPILLLSGLPGCQTLLATELLVQTKCFIQHFRFILF